MYCAILWHGPSLLDFNEQVNMTMVTVASRGLIGALMLLGLSGCATTKTASDGWVGFSETGKASYYADKHQNHKTASGALYKHELKTAAHKKLPFGSVVKVTNLSNGKSVVVTINDRGPFVKGRIIDLSKSAFRSIGALSAGLLKVEIEVLE